MGHQQTARRVAVYARVSTNDQTAENQLLDLRRHASQRGWNIVHEFVDEGISGAKSRRPQLDRLMADARQRKFDAVLVWRFDRFARSTTHLLAALEEFRTLDVDFVSLQEAIDTSTPMGKMIFTVVAAVAELERSIINERVRCGLARARSQGKRLGRPKANVDASRLLKLRQQGLSVRMIAAKLGLPKSTVADVLKSLPA